MFSETAQVGRDQRQRCAVAAALAITAALLVQPSSIAQTASTAAIGTLAQRAEVVSPQKTPAAGHDDPALLAPAATVSFSGISDTGAFPPSPSIAVGPNHIIQMVNRAFRMSNKAGTELEFGFLSNFPWSGVDQTGTKASFNPKVIYDHFADRWAMLALNRDTTTGVSNYLLAASITADPTGSWCAVAVRADLNGSTASGNWANHAQLGFDNTNFYITSDQYSFATGAFAYGKLRVMAKSQFAACGTFTWADFTNISGAPAGLAPARTFGTPGVGYIMNAAPAGGSTLSIRTITGTWPNPSSIVPVLSAAASVNVQPYTTPTDAPSSGSTTPVDTGDARLLNVVYRNGFLFAAHTVGSSCPDAATPSCARYYQITPGASPTVSIQESVGSAGLYHFYPAVEPDPSNNIFLVFGRTRASQFIESAYTVRKTTDSAMQASNPLQIGSSSYTRNDSAGVNRWGPYGGAAVDPSDGTVWVTHAAAGSTQNTWVTRVAKLSLNLPGPFGKTFPVDGAVEQNIYPMELSWGASSGTGSYAYCVDTTDDNECDDDLWMYVGPFISASFTGLSPDTTYYWHVKRTNANGDTYADGGSSAWWSFRTISPPSAFNKIGPADTATGVSTSPTLSWGTTTRFVRYDYCLQQTRNNNVCSQWIQAGTNTSKALTGLLAGTTYYWQVRALGLGGTTYADGNGSALWSFTTQPAGPGAFEKTGPADGLTGVTTSPTLSWGTSAGATGYEYCFDTSNDNVCSQWTSAGTNTQVTLTNMTEDPYYWHVRALMGGGVTYADGSATAFHFFRTAGPFNDRFLNATGILSLPYQASQSTVEATTGPEDPAVPCGNDNRSRSVWYEYTPDANVEVNINTFGSDYDTIVTAYRGWPGNFVALGCNDDSDGLSSSITVQATADQQLWILITSYHATGGNLVLNVTALPGAFGKTGPANGTIGHPSSVQLGWGASPGVLEYQYCIDASNDDACTDWTSVFGNTTSVSVSNLSPGTVYYWQVRAVNNGGQTYADDDASAYWSFTTERPAFGQVDTPSQNASGVQGAIGVTGWALDDVGVNKVEIYRNCLPFEPGNCQTILGQSLVYVGEAAFLTGARPDVAAAFPTHPNKDRAGWGYLMLTPMLPHVPNGQPYGGVGPLTIVAIATDTNGHQTPLGRSSDPASPIHSAPTAITMSNDTIAKPFGAIDTPAQGQTISGIFNNFGWALTPDSNTAAGDPGDITIPKNGSTIAVFIDALPVAQVAYDQCRGTVGNPVPIAAYCDDDVANIFGNATPLAPLTPRVTNPTLFRNLDAGRAAIGAYTINSTSLSNGLHTIAWSVTDSQGRNDGIGSRFFVVSNPAPASPDEPRSTVPVTMSADTPLPALPALTTTAQLPVRLPASGGVWWRTGFDLAARWEKLSAADSGDFVVRLPELGRLELWLGEAVEAGYLVANDELQPLPIGAALSGSRFGWMPPAGYTGAYDFTFVRDGKRIDVTVIVVEKGR